ncbi:LacI family DNA-binding transcriptional regulator [Aerococcaceae bacterium zg-BR9]|uniref:LacI family DNA-binding transcriptional regulator n=1 Tax=Aerococcaceae bacterium zg-1292 TaxID=2774330 RepID=UPI00406430EB|nr:LacI family DNA-binding transcriptional regulator [Aerococcaceae bacterium zg-BR9]
MNINDIAKLADVSVSTVSLALNNKKGVGAKTREKILQIAKEHNYSPQNNSKNKNTYQKKININFIVALNNEIISNDFRTQPFFNSLIETISQNNNNNFSVAISTASSEFLIDEILKYNESESTDGIIILATDLTQIEITKISHANSKPLILLDNTTYSQNISTVGINNEQGVYLALKYLADKGHRKVGYVMSEKRINNFIERKKAFVKYTDHFNLKFDSDNIVSLSPNTIDAQEINLNSIVSSKNVPSAFFCENDVLAISFLKSLQQKGYTIPSDFSLIGFDNIRDTMVVSPEITTIDVNQKNIVEETLMQIAAQIYGKKYTKHVVVNCELIERNSVKSRNL